MAGLERSFKAKKGDQVLLVRRKDCRVLEYAVTGFFVSRTGNQIELAAELNSVVGIYNLSLYTSYVNYGGLE